MKLTPEQEEVLQAATAKGNIFFTGKSDFCITHCCCTVTKLRFFIKGSAGTGKSYLLKIIISALPPDETVATASTGAAACLIGGITLHSFTGKINFYSHLYSIAAFSQHSVLIAGIGGGNVTLEKGIELASRSSNAQNWRRCKYLIIDEISMIDGDYFEVLPFLKFIHS